ncbi:MAG: succinate CoA transferase [Bacteroidales bacterium]|nr:succinate CoA transferase [Candidatus Liminaster caballi]
MKYKKMTAEQAAALIKHGDTVSVSGFTAAGSPRVVTAALAVRAEAEHEAGREFKINLYTGALTNECVDEALAKAHAIDKRMPFQGSPAMRAGINAGEINYFDMHLSVVGQYVRYGFLGKIDYCIIEALAINEDGEIVLSGGVGCVDTYSQVADKIIIELNSAYDAKIRGLHDIYTPATPPHRREIPIYEPQDRIGSPILRVDPKKVVAVVDCHYKYGVKPFTPVDETTAQLGKNVARFLTEELQSGRIPAEFLPLQSGVGNVSNAILHELQEADDIPPFKLYTEVLQDQVIDLIDMGRCTFASSGSLALSDEVYDKVMDNIDFYKQHIVLRPYELSNHPEIVRRLGIVAINTALEADIFGNVNSTHVMGTKMMNGVGGAADFARNAYISVFICPSVAKGGSISAIVPYVSHVDSSEHSVMVLITEQGIADLRGKSPRQRAELIVENCAHPSYRPLLREYLKLMDGVAGHTPLSLHNAFSFHEEFLRSGDMHNTQFE